MIYGDAARRCANCIYHVYDDRLDECVCVNEEGPRWLSSTPHDDVCECWQKKPYGGNE